MLIAEGKFSNEEEVVAEGLRLIVMQDKLHKDIQAGIDDLDAGNRVEASQVYVGPGRTEGQLAARQKAGGECAAESMDDPP